MAACTAPGLKKAVANRLSHHLPITRWLPRITWSSIQRDMIAGVCLASLAAPESIAFASLAGLSAERGLYNSFIGPIMYGFFGTSFALVNGPTTIMSLLTRQAMPATWSGAALVPGSAAYADVASFGALCIFAIQLLLWLFKLEILVRLISAPVLSGFITGSVIAISSSQLVNLFGLSRCVPHGGGSTCSIFDVFQYIAGSGSNIHWANPAVALACIAFLLLAKHVLPPYLPRRLSLLPYAAPLLLVIIAASLCYSYQGPAAAVGLKLVGSIPPGLPKLNSPLPPSSSRPLDDIGGMFTSFLPVAIIGFIESLSAARAAANAALANGKRTQLEAALAAGKGKREAEVAGGAAAAASAATASAAAGEDASSSEDPTAGEQLEQSKHSMAAAALDSNQEILANSMCNLGNAVLGGYTCSGSFSRSALNVACGVQTALGSVMGGLLMIVVLLWLAPALSYLPKVSLASIVIVVVLRLLDLKELLTLFKTDKRDFLVMLSVLLVNVFVSVPASLLAGIALQWFFSFTRTFTLRSEIRLWAWQKQEQREQQQRRQKGSAVVGYAAPVEVALQITGSAPPAAAGGAAGALSPSQQQQQQWQWGLAQHPSLVADLLADGTAQLAVELGFRAPLQFFSAERLQQHCKEASACYGPRCILLDLSSCSAGGMDSAGCVALLELATEMLETQGRALLLYCSGDKEALEELLDTAERRGRKSSMQLFLACGPSSLLNIHQSSGRAHVVAGASGRRVPQQGPNSGADRPSLFASLRCGDLFILHSRTEALSMASLLCSLPAAADLRAGTLLSALAEEEGSQRQSSRGKSAWRSSSWWSGLASKSSSAGPRKGAYVSLNGAVEDSQRDDAAAAESPLLPPSADSASVISEPGIALVEAAGVGEGGGVAAGEGSSSAEEEARILLKALQHSSAMAQAGRLPQSPLIQQLELQRRRMEPFIAEAERRRTASSSAGTAAGRHVSVSVRGMSAHAVQGQRAAAAAPLASSASASQQQQELLPPAVMLFSSQHTSAGAPEAAAVSSAPASSVAPSTAVWLSQPSPQQLAAMLPHLSWLPGQHYWQLMAVADGVAGAAPALALAFCTSSRLAEVLAQAASQAEGEAHQQQQAEGMHARSSSSAGRQGELQQALERICSLAGGPFPASPAPSAHACVDGSVLRRQLMELLLPGAEMERLLASGQFSSPSSLEKASKRTSEGCCKASCSCKAAASACWEGTAFHALQWWSAAGTVAGVLKNDQVLLRAAAEADSVALQAADAAALEAEGGHLGRQDGGEDSIGAQKVQ